MANIENTASRSPALIVNKADGSAGLISLHIRSVCERLSVMKRLPESGMAKFVLKSLRTPYCEIWYRTHPTSQVEILSFDYYKPPSSPSKIEIWADLGTLSFDYHRTPPTHTKN